VRAGQGAAGERALAVWLCGLRPEAGRITAGDAADGMEQASEAGELWCGAISGAEGGAGPAAIAVGAVDADVAELQLTVLGERRGARPLPP
jgi:hypothetical protein